MSVTWKLGQFRWSGFFSYRKTGNVFNGINYRHLSSDRKRWDISFISSESNLLELFSQVTFPQCYITYCLELQNWVNSDGLDFFLSINREYFWRNQLSASILGPEPHTYSFHLFQIEFSGTFLTSHISTMLHHIASATSKFGQFRWSGFFSYQQNGKIFKRINYRHLSSDRNCIDNISIFSKSNLLELLSQATFPQCYIT